MAGRVVAAFDGMSISLSDLPTLAESSLAIAAMFEDQDQEQEAMCDGISAQAIGLHD